jgi:hypothetical protein
MRLLSRLRKGCDALPGAGCGEPSHTAPRSIAHLVADRRSHPIIIGRPGFEPIYADAKSRLRVLPIEPDR